MNSRKIVAVLFSKMLLLLCSVFLLSLLVFYVSRLAPGDPLMSYYGERAEKMSPQEQTGA